MSTFLKTPFAENGDVTTIPRDSQVTGEISFNEGYPPLYSADQSTDPDALDVEREKFNYLMNVLSSAIREWQTQSIPAWITSADNDGTPYPYPKYARVMYMGAAYESQKMNNTSAPTVLADWLPVNLPQYATIVDTVMTGQANAQALNVAGSPVVTLTQIPYASGGSGIYTWEVIKHPNGYMQITGVIRIDTVSGGEGTYYYQDVTFPDVFLTGTKPKIQVTEGYTGDDILAILEAGEKTYFTMYETTTGFRCGALRVYGSGSGVEYSNVIYRATGKWK